MAGPQHGTLTLDADGGFYYTPQPGFTGTDSFQYKANDGTSDSNVATVTIDVVPFHHAPSGTSSTVSVPPGPSYTLSAADFGFSDPGDTPPDTFTAVEITTLPASASLTLSGAPVTPANSSQRPISPRATGLEPRNRQPAHQFHLPGGGQRQHGQRRGEPGPGAQDAYLRFAAGRAGRLLLGQPKRNAQPSVPGQRSAVRFGRSELIVGEPPTTNSTDVDGHQVRLHVYEQRQQRDLFLSVPGLHTPVELRRRDLTFAAPGDQP